MNQGYQWEQQAVDYLVFRGLSILERNWRTRFAEVDIIVQEDNCLVFVEVRYRKSTRFGHPLETINRAKQRKIRQASLAYIKHISWKGQIRFDVVAITANSFQWLKGAF